MSNLNLGFSEAIIHIHGHHPRGHGKLLYKIFIQQLVKFVSHIVLFRRKFELKHTLRIHRITPKLFSKCILSPQG